MKQLKFTFRRLINIQETKSNHSYQRNEKEKKGVVDIQKQKRCGGSGRQTEVKMFAILRWLAKANRGLYKQVLSKDVYSN